MNSILISQILSEDPSGAFAYLDDETVARYLQAIHYIATGLKRSALEVVTAAKELADNNRSASWDKLLASAAPSHIGYYLLGNGREELEETLTAHRIPLLYRVRRWLRRNIQLSVIILILSLSIALFEIAMALSTNAAVSTFKMLLAAALLLLPIVTLAEFIIMTIFGVLTPKRNPLALNFNRDIPTAARTAILVHSVCRTTSDLLKTIDNFNKMKRIFHDPGFIFVLCIDPVDSASAETPEDKAMIEDAKKVLTDSDTVLLFRKRTWSNTQHCYIGWDRKRGKIQNFNELLLYGNDKAFHCPTNNTEILNDIRFVITIDDDSWLTPHTARRLVETISHPLNLPLYDDVKKAVVQGYSIIQPMLSIIPWNHDFPDEMVGSTAKPPAMTSLFQLGNYMGKGIYEVKSFHQSTSKIPEETITSHDVLEGALSKVVTTSNAIIGEHAPRHSVLQIERFHRWYRGDWQLLPWLIPSMFCPHPLPLFSFEPWHRWILCGQLRKNNLPLFLAITLTPWILPEISLVTALICFINICFLEIVDCAKYFILAISKFTSFKINVPSPRSPIRCLSDIFGRLLIFYPLAWAEFTAICIALWRMYISRKNLLEWRAAATVEKEFNASLLQNMKSFYRAFPLCCMSAISIALSTGFWHPSALLLSCWLYAPFYFLKGKKEEITAVQE